MIRMWGVIKARLFFLFGLTIYGAIVFSGSSYDDVSGVAGAAIGKNRENCVV